MEKDGQGSLLMSNVSFLIPCFNASAHLEPMLKSVLSNMEMDDDIIVVDDHSQDDSTARAKHILSQANVHHTVTTNPGKGACSARNHAFSLAQGELIQWLDADDILGPDKLAKQRQHLEAQSSELVVSPFASFIGTPEHGTINENRDWSSPPNPTPADWLASGQMTIPACWLGHRSVFEKAGKWDESLLVNQDGEYFARVLAAANRLRFEGTVHVHYRKGNAGSVSRFSAEKADSLFRSVESIHTTASSLKTSERMQQMVANKYQHAIYTAFPHCPEGAARAKAALKTLPKPTISNPNAVSTLSKGISFLLGWKSLTRLRMLKTQFRAA